MGREKYFRQVNHTNICFQNPFMSEIMKYLTPLFHLTENHNNSINSTNTMISHSMNVGDDTNLRSTRMRMTSQLHDRIHVTSKGERGVKKGLHLNHQKSCTCCFPATEEEVLSPWQRNMTWFLPSSSKYGIVIMSFDPIRVMRRRREEGTEIQDSIQDEQLVTHKS